jgi:3-oxoadipate enol-lactonase
MRPMSSSSSANLAHVLHGSGPARVLVLHDWLGDRRNWEPLLPYLDGDRFTYAFVDLRGYGGSRDIEGAYTVDETASDALAVATRLDWQSFAVVGHSMSGLIVQAMAAAAPSRISRLVAVTPVGPGGLFMPPEVVGFMEKISLDPALRQAALRQSWGDRLSERWLAFKCARWAESSKPEAVLGYLRMFARTDLRERVKGLAMPILAVAGEHDQPWFQAEALRAGFASYSGLEVATIGNAGHYPMQETPVALATVMERFLGA